MSPTDQEADRISRALLRMWAEALDTPEGREAVQGALCRTIQGVATGPCAQVCPMASVTPGIQAAVAELAHHLAGARDHVDFLAEVMRQPLPAR